jgi:hypothetical protein
VNILKGSKNKWTPKIREHKFLVNLRNTEGGFRNGMLSYAILKDIFEDLKNDSLANGQCKFEKYIQQDADDIKSLQEKLDKELDSIKKLDKEMKASSKSITKINIQVKKFKWRKMNILAKFLKPKHLLQNFKSLPLPRDNKDGFVIRVLSPSRI